jgi:soluble lytic murein transglycosylase
MRPVPVSAFSFALVVGLAAVHQPGTPTGPGSAASLLPGVSLPDPGRSESAASTSLELLLSRPALDGQDGVEALSKGLRLLNGGDAAGARTAFLDAATLLPVMEDWALVLAADATATQGDVDGARELLARIDPWLARAHGWRTQARALRQAGRGEEALLVALDAADRLESPARRAEAALGAAEIQISIGDTTGAYGSLRRAMEEAPLATAAIDAARRLSDLPRASAEDHLAVGRLYARHGNATRALAGIDRFVASGRGSVFERSEARVDAARVLFNAGRYADAERRLTSLVNEQLPDSLAAETLLLLGRAKYRRDQVTAARTTLLQTGELYPGQRATTEALFIVADLDHDRARFDNARSLYEKAIHAYPSDERGADSAVRLGGLLLTQGEAGAAAAVFETMRAAHPAGERRQQAAFWAGRAWLSAGDSARATPFLREAVAHDPASWYGQRAADLMGMSSWADALAPSPETGLLGVRQAEAALRRLDVLKTLGMTSSVELELERIEGALAGREAALYTIAEGLHERGELLPAVLMGRRIRRAEGEWNARLLRIVFPFPFREEIVATASRRGLDPYLVAGLIRQESLFDPSARSSAGAVGLMQVRPPTGRELAQRDGVRGFQPTQLRQPELNIRLGTLFFADLLNRYSGRVGWVLAAYNAGPSRLARWREMPEAVDPDVFAERIPFKETRDYVKVVQQNASIYRVIYAE